MQASKTLSMKKYQTFKNYLSNGGVIFLFYKLLEIYFWKLLDKRNWSRAILPGKILFKYFPENKMIARNLAYCQINNYLEKCMKN
jgi:hypothetical protein